MGQNNFLYIPASFLFGETFTVLTKFLNIYHCQGIIIESGDINYLNFRDICLLTPTNV